MGLIVWVSLSQFSLGWFRNVGLERELSVRRVCLWVKGAFEFLLWLELVFLVVEYIW